MQPNNTTSPVYAIETTHSGLHAVSISLRLALALAVGDMDGAKRELDNFLLATRGRTATLSRLTRDITLRHLDAIAVDGHGDELSPEPVTPELVAGLDAERTKVIALYAEQIDNLELGDADFRSRQG